ncbi:MAG: Scr1 family TA system antitoxin-like transcriptional regulator [Actinoallomurus sp.]
MTTSGGFAPYFGTELRRLRERLGWNREQFSDRLPWSVWTISSVEQGRRKPPPGLGEHADMLFGLPGVMTNLGVKAQDDSSPFGDFVDLEQRSDGVRMYDMRLIPGLLQTEAYARAVNQRQGQYVSPDDLEHAIEMRLQRQRILNGEAPTTLHAILDEAVLCRRIGDAEVMRAQLRALTVRRQHVTIQILPFWAGTNEFVGGPLTLLHIPGEPDVAYADGWAHGLVIDTPAEVLRAERAFEQLAALALPPDMSVEIIQAYVEEL